MGLGETFSSKRPPGDGIAVDIESISEKPIAQIEILVNGELVESVVPDLMKTPAGAWRAKVSRRVTIKETSWLAVRSIEPQPDGRKRFAHTAPWHFVVNSQSHVPRRVQVQYFISLMEQEIQRNREILPRRRWPSLKWHCRPTSRWSPVPGDAMLPFVSTCLTETSSTVR